MILHIAVAVHRLRQKILLELSENLIDGLAQNVGQDVEPAAMRHADNDFADQVVGRPLDDGFQDGNKRLGAFQGKALLTGEARLQKMLEKLGVMKALENLEFLGVVEAGPIATRLHAFLEPTADACVLNVHVLNADGAAVSVTQRFRASRVSWRGASQ